MRVLRRRAVAIAVVAALAPRAAAEPESGTPVPKTGAVHLKTPSDVKTDGGSVLRLPPGYFVDEPSWGKLDAEMKRAQDAETRLSAENVSLRKSASGFSFGWKSLSTVFVLGVAAGVYANRKL